MLSMNTTTLGGAFLGLLLLSAIEPAWPASIECAGCHQGIWETYQRTGMARSFYRPYEAAAVEDYTKNNTYYHEPSNSYFTMLQRDGKYYQRRYQLGPDGKQTNILEKQIDYVMGSGLHARAYLNRTAHNTLVELPLAWYSENGGYWAMNPGYDRPDHEGFRRTITYDCMFCHNAYPATPPGSDQPLAEPLYSGTLPEGIDCQRCHGSGARHIQLARTPGTAPAAIRGAIVNPARLTPRRQMEVCMQCHLETTSFPLPNAIQRYERGPFSYKPGEPLSDFILSFDNKGHDDKFELVSAAYRLRQSACFLKSSGKLLCTTCHNPHDIPRGQAAERHYTAVCRQCHSAAFNQLVASGKHPRSESCTACHMPKRRTEDVVHAAVTDHYIQRFRPAGDLLAAIPERHQADGDYQGPVVPYYPATAVSDLYLAIAQIIQRSNLISGIAQLTAAIKQHAPQRAEYYFQLAEGLRMNGQWQESLKLYKQAVQRNPQFVFALQRLASALRHIGQNAEAETYLKQAASASPQNPITWRELGLTYLALNKQPDAVAALQKAIAIYPDMAEAHNNLGVIQSSEASFREAIRLQPDYADARANLANLTQSPDDFEAALKLRPNDAPTRFNYAMLLGRERHFDQAQTQLEAALRADPNFAGAHTLLADLLMAASQIQPALQHYREALRIQPNSGKAHLGLGLALASTGDIPNALPHLRQASADPDPSIREDALQALHQLEK
jgi:predicted CXXCH cytochrome family protein